ncbi:MAG: SDR family oxidoreductase [Patescibacteria group bacterium]|nr:SDR family oxidoreductase [Patescibacteria group bacterium]
MSANQSNLGKILFLTGGHGEIGAAIAKKFQAKGWEVIAPTSNELDLVEPDAIVKYFQTWGGDVDAIIHCAGVNVPKPLERLDWGDLEKTMRINALGFAEILRHLAPSIKKKKSGYVLAISSIYGVISRALRLPYAMSKHALGGLVQTLAIELGPFNIKVNALAPGVIDTRLTTQNNSPEEIAELKAGIPLGRLGKPEDIANAAYFLCSEANGFITGQTIVADGGYIIGGFQK